MGYWENHNAGGPCPIPGLSAGEYDIQTRDLQVMSPKCISDRCNWGKIEGAGAETVEIIAYRVTKESEMTDPYEHITDNQAEQIFEMHDAGRGWIDIANALGLRPAECQGYYDQAMREAAEDGHLDEDDEIGGTDDLPQEIVDELSDDVKAKVEAARQSPAPEIISPSSIKTKISKTSVGLRDVLFQTMEELRAGKIEVSDAMGVCALSKEICSTVKLEMDAEKLRMAMPKDSEISALALGSDAS